MHRQNKIRVCRVRVCRVGVCRVKVCEVRGFKAKTSNRDKQAFLEVNVNNIFVNKVFEVNVNKIFEGNVNKML